MRETWQGGIGWRQTLYNYLSAPGYLWLRFCFWLCHDPNAVEPPPVGMGDYKVSKWDTPSVVDPAMAARIAGVAELKREIDIMRRNGGL